MMKDDGLVKNLWKSAGWHRSKAHIHPQKISGIKNRYNTVDVTFYDAIILSRNYKSIKKSVDITYVCRYITNLVKGNCFYQIVLLNVNPLNNYEIIKNEY